MFVLIITVLTSILSIVLYQIKFHRRNFLLSKIPSRKKWFILHNSPQVVGKSLDVLFKEFESWHEELGSVCQLTLHLFDAGIALVADPKLAEVLSLHQPDRSRSMLYEPLSRWIGLDGFLLSPANKAKSMMKPLLNVFHPKFIDRYISVMNTKTNETIKILASKHGESFDIYPFARAVVLDTTFEIVMGVNLNASNGSNFHYVNAIIRICEIAMTCILSPISRYSFLHQFTSLGREEKKVLKILHDFTRSIVRDRRKELADGLETTEWFMLNHYLQNEVDGRFLSDDEIRAEIDTIIFGAHDTSKTTISFAIYELARNPDIQKKVYEEACNLLKDDPWKDIVESDLSQFPYTEAVIKETLRLYPPVPYLGRKMSSEITAGGYTFPKDIEVVFSPYLIGRNPKYFDNPLTFNPERFYLKEGTPVGFIPFSIGARKCMGGKIALMSLKLTLAKLIFHCHVFTTPGNEDVEVLSELILKPKNGIILRTEKRVHEFSNV